MKARVVNALSTAMVALLFSHVLHETVHLVMALLVGARVNRFNLFAVSIELYGDRAHLWHDIAIEAGSSIVNVLVGFAALAVFTLLRSGRPLLKQFFLQLTGYNLLMGFGYFLFDSLFYSPDVPGDWRSVITMLDGSIALRVALIVVGTAGLLFTFFHLAAMVAVFVRDRQDPGSRYEAAFPVLLIPYIFFGLLYLVFSFWHPLGFPEGLIITFLQFFFGFSGFLWAFFLFVHWLGPNHKTPFYGVLPAEVNRPWLAAAIVIYLVKVLVFLPTIDFV